MKDTRRAFILAAGSTAAAMSLLQEVVRAADDATRDSENASLWITGPASRPMQRKS